MVNSLSLSIFHSFLSCEFSLYMRVVCNSSPVAMYCVYRAIFLYSCLDCQSYSAHAIYMGWATWANRVGNKEV